jgi:hypothetical protein
MTDQSGVPNRRNITLTVIVLIGLIAIGVLIGILSIRWGGPVVPPPERAQIEGLVAGLNTIFNAGAVL